MSPLRCPRCAADALADQQFCETCGAAVGHERDAARRHVEIDVAVAAAVSDVGLVHERNEDAAFLAVGPDGVVAVVCDGVSSSSGAQVAAEVAATTVGQALATAGTASLDRMADALRRGGERVAALAWSDDADGDPPSCTAVAALVDASTITVGWAGDSRAYWVDRDEVVRLTVDHSWARAQIDAGTMTGDAAMADRRAHAITRWLGADQPPDKPAVTAFTPSCPGHLVLCSDGLWNEVDDDELAATLYDVGHDAGRHPLDAAAGLTAAALAGGGRDNVTVIVVAVPVV